MKALVYLQEEWFLHFKDKEQIDRGLDLLLLIFKDLLYIQIGKQEQAVFISEIYVLEQYALQTSRTTLSRSNDGNIGGEKKASGQYESTIVNGAACVKFAGGIFICIM